MIIEIQFIPSHKVWPWTARFRKVANSFGTKISHFRNYEELKEYLHIMKRTIK